MKIGQKCRNRSEIPATDNPVHSDKNPEDYKIAL